MHVREWRVPMKGCESPRACLEETGSNPLPWGHNWLKSSEKQKVAGLAAETMQKDHNAMHWMTWVLRCTSSWNRTGVDLAVVPPAFANRAAALLLGGVSRHNVVAEVGVIQVDVTLFLLFCCGGRRRDSSWQFDGHISCRRTKRELL